MIKAIDFFCGGGGMTNGLREAGVDVIAGVDTDRRAKKLTNITTSPRDLFKQTLKQ